ncbi:3'-5' exonuclease [Buchnera aphidicola]|uniref:3'-5' exonuclease n=1 Tax=Buchnera aphidicola TaxID=9 RepID=UPI00346489CC
MIKLEENYRSVKRIIKIANSVISHTINIYEKCIFSNLEHGIKTKIIKLRNEKDESESVLDEAHKISLKSSFFNYKDCAILYINNYQSHILEKACIKKIFHM